MKDIEYITFYKGKRIVRIYTTTDKPLIPIK